ncbi:unnamed protein product [Calypogeia fissa]
MESQLQEVAFSLSSTIFTAFLDRAPPRIDEGIEDFYLRANDLRKIAEPIRFVAGGNSEARVSREGKTARASFGFAKVKGPKKLTVEDFHVARIQEVDNQNIGLFAIMDGHAGPDVAVFLTDNLFEVITTHPEFWKDPKKAISEAYHETDERIIGMGNTDMKLRVGSTATTALLLDNGKHLIVANVGDSRAVLSRKGKALDLSVDHEPQKPDERQMVESKGGVVSRSVASGIYRVDRRLAMSRAFGDYDLKQHLSVQPDIWDEQLVADDEFFVIASDGVWHVMNSQEVVDLVRSTPGTAQEVAQAVVSAALQRDSRDDITCLIVFL